MSDIPVNAAAINAAMDVTWRGQQLSGPHAASILLAAGPELAASALRQAADDLLATGGHEDLCDYGPPGTCGCALGRHYRWLRARADALTSGVTVDG